MSSPIQLPPKVLTASPQLPTQLSQKTTQENQERVQFASAEDIRDVITEFLSQGNIPYHRTPYDRDLHDLCIQECKLKGYPIDRVYDGKPPILKYIPSGVIFASTGYAHHKNQSIKVFIALCTTLLLWLDDAYAQDIRGIDSFNERFTTGQQQANEALDGLDRFLREIHLHYPGIQANVILTSILNFVTWFILDFETQGMAVSPHAKSYPTFQRIMSGISDAYAIFVFPPEIPLESYVRAVPELCLVCNYLNDIFSFYKEELAGENTNYISHEASQRGETKIAVLRKLAQDVLLCISSITNILEGNGEAQAAFRCIAGGYVSYHASNSRYHLDDLFPLQ